jgi:hypothetical protein
MVVGLCRALLILMVGLGAALTPCSAAESQGPPEGASLPAITLPVPKDAGHQSYLGLKGAKEFTIADIQTEVVIIEIFNMY